MNRLSKSKYTKFRQCDKSLWLRLHKPETATENPLLAARFQAGDEVGDLAMFLFGDYTEVTETKADGRLDLKAMIANTLQCIQDGTETICEASFIYDGCFCAVDILRKTKDGYDIFEVKSSTTSEETEGKTTSKTEVYAQDISYQKWVLTQCGIQVTGTYLVRLDSNYVRGEELDIKQLFIITDMSDAVANEYNKIEQYVNSARTILQSDDEPETELSIHCHKPYHYLLDELNL